ncbi:hypothetical protein QQ045_009688 [Rhodiola kirilowii]
MAPGWTQSKRNKPKFQLLAFWRRTEEMRWGHVRYIRGINTSRSQLGGRTDAHAIFMEVDVTAAMRI